MTNSPDVNIPGAIIGGVLGGVLGHQIGGGRGQDIATGVGAVGGAVVGANVGRGSGGQQVTTQDVERCTSESVSSRPDYWDVTYDFRGIQHRVQMTAPPDRRSSSTARVSRALTEDGVADGIRTHDNRNHNPGLYR